MNVVNKSFLEKNWFKPRNLISNSFDETLQEINKIIPLKIFSINSFEKAYTWIVPEKWECNDAYIEFDCKKILNFKLNPLCVVQYSLPIDLIVSKNVLLEHLNSKPELPDAVPFEFSYYSKKWGFCISENQKKNLQDGNYHVVIDSKFEKGNLQVGEFNIKGKNPETIVLMAHLDHPYQCNDGLSGVAGLIELALKLSEQENNYSYKFLILPETIGCIAYLSQHEFDIPNFKYGIDLDMLGLNNPITLQRSRQQSTQIDKIAVTILDIENNFGEFVEFTQNDEYILNGTGFNIPTIAITRGVDLNYKEFEERHSDKDTIELFSQEKFDESIDFVLKILNVLDKNYFPVRKFKAPIMLSRYNLWVDWRKDMELNKKVNQIMLSLEGDESVFDISKKLDLDFYFVYNYLEQFYSNNLIEKRLCE